jgi:hypothetical protein
VSDRTRVQHGRDRDQICNEWHGYTHDALGDYVCPGYPHPVLSDRQIQALAMLRKERGVWRTCSELGTRGTTMWQLHRLGYVERHELGPKWYAYRVPLEEAEHSR